MNQKIADMEMAALEIDAAADRMFPLLAKLNRLAEILEVDDTSGLGVASPSVRVAFADLLEVYEAAERAFFRNSDYYKGFKQDWIVATDSSFV